jgi:hypothetical protein
MQRNAWSWCFTRAIRPAGCRPRRSLLHVEELESRTLLSLFGQNLFPAEYPYNQSITNAPVAANSAAMINFMQHYDNGTYYNWALGFESGNMEAKNQNWGMYGIAYNVVHGNTAAWVNVNVFKYGTGGRTVPYTLSVPMPTNAVLMGDHWTGPNTTQGYGPGGRGDSDLIVYDEDNNIDYEFFGVSRPNEPWGDTYTNPPDGVTWHAKSGAVWDLNRDSLAAAPGGSADAAGLAILPLLVRPDEALPPSQGGQGVIKHAIRMTWQNAVIRNMFEYPASATANNGNNLAVMPPMGARLRLKSSFVIPSTWGPVSKAIAQALKDYGAIIADNGANNSCIGAAYSVDANNVPNMFFDQGSDAYDWYDINSGAIRLSDLEFVDQTPVVSGLSEAVGKAGDTVTITGQNFSYALPGQLSVLFGSTPATNVTVLNDGTLTANVPDGAGTVNVWVQSGVTNSAYQNNMNAPIFGYGVSKQKVTFTYPPGAPNGVKATPGPGQVTVSWSAVSGAATYNLYRSTTSGAETLYASGITGTSYADTGVKTGVVYYYEVTAFNGAESAPSGEVSARPQPPGLPDGWTDQDIDGAFPAGSAVDNGGTWTVTGGGGGIFGTFDRFNFASTSVTGDATFTAELTSFNGKNYSALAALMWRNSTAAGDTFVDVGYSPGWGAWMQWRSTANTNVQNTRGLRVPVPSPQHPLWLKLVRQGATFTGYVSADGTTWAALGSTTAALNTTALAGLAVTSEYSAPAATAIFTNVGLS